MLAATKSRENKSLPTCRRKYQNANKHTQTHTHTHTYLYTYANCVVFHYEIKQAALQQQLISLDKNKLHKYLRQAEWPKRGCIWPASERVPCGQQ